MTQQQYLLLRLQAPMAAFGGVMLDNYGVTRNYPAKSMLTGLLGNALGWKRNDFDRLQQLQDRIMFAVRVDNPVDGRQWRDFQTAEIGASDKHWTTSGEPAQRAGGAKSYSGPHLRHRHYLHDLIATVALGLAHAETEPSIATCEKALVDPARPLFIGRKACLPSCPIFQATVSATSALQALRSAKPASDTNTTVKCYWMPSDSADEMPDHIVVNEFELCDERDWRNSQHTGTRPMCEANLPADWFRGLH